MPDVFISYSSADERFARFLDRHLAGEGLEVFLASTSLIPGQQWAPSILEALRHSDWIVFLASRAACESAWVQQELGAALITEKKVVPIVWDMPPSRLPGWISNFQALDLAGASPEHVRARIGAIAERMKADKARGQLIAALLIAGLVFLGARQS